MDNKNIGVILLIFGIILSSVLLIVKLQEDSIMKKIMEQQGSCFLEDGTCIHERNITFYIIGWIISGALIALSLYLAFFEKSQKEIINTLEKQKKIQTEEEKFNILLKGLNQEEQKVIKAVKEQDGITQQTLRLRTDLHKSKLSIIISLLEQKGLVKKIKKGKTNLIFLRI